MAVHIIQEPSAVAIRRSVAEAPSFDTGAVIVTEA
jgi:hypothetical protein